MPHDDKRHTRGVRHETFDAAHPQREPNAAEKPDEPADGSDAPHRGHRPRAFEIRNTEVAGDGEGSEGRCSPAEDGAAEAAEKRQE